MAEAIVFDLWNTLVRNTCGRSLPSMIKNALGLSAMDAQQFRTFYDESFCLKKKESAQECMNELCGLCQINPKKEEFENALQLVHDLRHCVEPFPETFEVLTKLRKTRRLGVLTNTSYPALKFALQKVPLQKYVDFMIVSYEEHMIKPDPRLFSKVAQLLRLHPDNILVVGDNLYADIYGAKAVGFQALLLDRYGEYDYQPKIKDLRGVLEFV